MTNIIATAAIIGGIAATGITAFLLTTKDIIELEEDLEGIHE